MQLRSCTPERGHFFAFPAASLWPPILSDLPVLLLVIKPPSLSLTTQLHLT